MHEPIFTCNLSTKRYQGYYPAAPTGSLLPAPHTVHRKGSEFDNWGLQLYVWLWKCNGFILSRLESRQETLHFVARKILSTYSRCNKWFQRQLWCIFSLFYTSYRYIVKFPYNYCMYIFLESCCLVGTRKIITCRIVVAYLIYIQ